MNALPLVILPRASRDVDDAVDFHLVQATVAVADAFITALQQTFDRIADYPSSGSTRYADVLGLPGLRHVPIQGWPYIVFYLELSGRVDIWRVLHGARDIPAWLLEEGGFAKEP